MIIEIALFIIGIVLLLHYFHFGSKPSGTPPGILGLPIIGVLPPVSHSFEEYINKCRKEYGNTFWLKMGSRNVVYICDYEDIAAAFNNPSLQGRPDFFSDKLIYVGKERGIIFGVGRSWKNLRRFSIRRLRDGGMGKSSISSVILREAESLAEDFGKYVGKPTQLPWSINGCTLNIIWKLVSDQRYDVSDPEMYILYTTITDLINQLQGFGINLLDFMPWIGNWTPEIVHNVLGKASVIKKADKLFKLIYESVEEHKKSLDEDDPKDLIDSYLIEMNKLTSDSKHRTDDNSTFSEKELIYAIFDLFIAGSETTSSTIRWYLLLMAKYPHIQKRVHEELDKLIVGNKTVSLDDKENLPLLEATIHETLRLKPILPFGVFHSAIEDTTFDNYFIPKGTIILANILGCHKNPKVWEKPNEFYPEHFLNEDKTFNYKKQSVLTFSTGRRVCPGENLARMDLFFVLATIMQRFSFTAAEGEPLSIEQSPDQPFFTLPKPFKIIINKR